ncbi:hypothetical protein K8I85_05910 [bacterium]|nr:hypothetical protein [bacterium]
MARRYDDPNAAPTAYVVALLAVLLIGAVFALEGYFGRVTSEEAEGKLISLSYEELENVRAAQAALIHRTEWIDREAGIVAIPVDRAMELVAAELEKTGGTIPSQ